MADTSIIQQCPSCARLLYFTHDATNIIQCTCGSVVVRKGKELIAKPFYIIQQPEDTIQPGTEGVFYGRSFRVLGRFRAWIEEFVCNYWTIVFDDNQTGYLVEGYGLYAIHEPTTVDRRLTSSLLEDIKVGAQRDLFTMAPFVLERKYTCYKWELEGEIFLPFERETFKTYEFAAVDGRHVEVMDFGSDRVATYQITYTSYSNLGLKHTRSYSPSTRTITCDKCKKANEVKGFPYIQSFACIHCEARYSLQNGYNFKREKEQNNTSNGTNITIGSKGRIKGIEYEVIGYALKEERKLERSQWKEYTLFNPEEGFAFLSEYNGHWIYVKERGDAPVIEQEHVQTFTYAEEPFQKYNSYSYNIINSVGAFPYNIFNDHDRAVKEFISPPEIWIQEKSPREGILWYHGEHISRRELSTAFGDNIVLPYKTGVGAVEPKGFVNPNKLVFVAFIAVVVLVLVHALTTFGAQKRVLVDQYYYMADSLTSSTFVTDKFTLDKWKSNLQFDIHAPVDNSWFELSATLVNAKTGTEYSLQQGVEYYHGYSDGESWSEGSQSETTYLSQIPAGTYYLQLQGNQERKYGDAVYSTQHSFSVKVTYDSPNDRNLVYCLIALLLWPLAQYQLVQYNEKSRWSNSPFSPFNED